MLHIQYDVRLAIPVSVGNLHALDPVAAGNHSCSRAGISIEMPLRLWSHALGTPQPAGDEVQCTRLVVFSGIPFWILV